MKDRDWYIEKLTELEKRLYDKDIHQVTIDLVQNSIIEIQDSQMGQKNYLPVILGSRHYRADIVHETMDKTTKDYEIVSELIKILDAE